MLESLYGPGLALRKEKLGAAVVDAALDTATDVSRPIQDFATEICWGFIWQRDQLSHRDRSLLNLAIASTLNRPAELKAQVKVALKNGLTPTEISEAILQIAVYCGLPAALDAAKIADEALASPDQPSSEPVPGHK